ncbi:MAG TPA: EI24 domain-containing protein [Rhodocyclaceae bacterium]|nr:EI24 domain-containing protein [Rhodocyclaceae bacterium]
MKKTLLAYGAAARSLLRADILWHLMWPTILSAALWVGGLAFGWSALVASAQDGLVALPWLGSWLAGSPGALVVVLVLFKIALVVLVLPVIYVTAAFLVAAIALPLMLETVARTDYADLARRGGGSTWGSVWNALVAVIVFLLLLVASLPLWLIPGAGLVISLLLTAWLNQRAFRYDALMTHADAYELKALPQQQSAGLFGVGLLGAVLAHVPLLNLFAPAVTGLAFVHYLLAALRDARRTENVIEVV